jgi:hypothetical protein
MTPVNALLYSIFFGLLHGILPDEHTWPITFSYAIGAGNGKGGMKAALYFSAAFTFQRAVVSELAYLALASFLNEPAVTAFTYMAVGCAMSVAGVVVLRRNRYPHAHLFRHHHAKTNEIDASNRVVSARHEEITELATAPPAHWAIVHGFIAGFGFGAFSLFINTVAAPAMTSPWLGYLPGLLFGLGTMIMQVMIGGVFGAFLHWFPFLDEQTIRRIGSLTSGRTLFFGGILFGIAGIAALAGLARYSPTDPGNMIMIIFTFGVVIPSLLRSLNDVRADRKRVS